MDGSTGEVTARGWAALKQGGPLWMWPVFGVVLVAVAGQRYGRGGALLAAGVGMVCFVLVGSQVLFGGRSRLYASGVAFCAGVVVVLLALVQPVARTGAVPTPADVPARPTNQDLLDRPTLAGALLRGSDLHGFTLAGENLGGAELAGANLRGAILTAASLRGADLSGADLRDACLDRVDLRGAVLDGALATRANTSGALVTAADTSSVVGWGSGRPRGCG